MPVRGRILSASLSQSRKFARLENNDHRLMYVLLIPHVDCEGRHDAEATILAGKCYTSLGFTPDQIMVALGDMANVGLIHLYEVDGDLFLEVDDFLEHQIIRRKSNGDPVREAPSRIPSRHDRGGTASVVTDGSGGSAAENRETQESPSHTMGRTTDAVVTQNCRTTDAELASQTNTKQSKLEAPTGPQASTENQAPANGAPRPKGRGPSRSVTEYMNRRQPRDKTPIELEQEAIRARKAVA